jgi:DNA-binding transcriptional MocR family regulator
LRLDQATPDQLRQWEISLSEEYTRIQQSGLNLNLTRGKPSADQLDLSNTLDGILNGDYSNASGTDLRNYGGLDGIPEAKTLFADVFGLAADEIMIGGNSSLTLMYFAVQTALQHGLSGSDSAWNKDGKTIKFLAPVPGYDRHFSVCEHLGIELVPVAMNNDGPDMDQVENLLRADPQIKGMWCVPRFSNPTGIVYSDEVVARMAKLATLAEPDFLLFWDNAYAVHSIEEGAPELANIMDACKAEGTESSLLIFGSTSKVTFAGAGMAFVASSPANLSSLKKHFAFSSIGPDKVNQMRHVKFLKNNAGIQQHMAAHAALLKPRFDAVISRLREHLADTGMGEWTEPKGGYFISFDTLPGLAKEVVRLASEAGVELTPAGATFPYGNDPKDRNIRIAPSFPTLNDIEQAMDVFVVCVKLASVRQTLANG